MGHAQEKVSELAELGPFRRDMYAILSSTFSVPPTRASMQGLCSEAFLSSAAGFFGKDVTDDLRRHAQSGDTEEEILEKACQEFMNLFKVPGRQYVTPFESVFLDVREIAGKPVNGLLMGQSAVDVQQWYRIARFEVAKDHGDLPDHIGMELAFLAALCAKEQELEAAGDLARRERAWEIERDFLAAHVLTWIGALTDKILQLSDHSFFRGAARLAREFTQRDLQTLEGVLGPSDGQSRPRYEKVDS